MYTHYLHNETVSVMNANELIFSQSVVNEGTFKKLYATLQGISRISLQFRMSFESPSFTRL